MLNSGFQERAGFPAEPHSDAKNANLNFRFIASLIGKQHKKVFSLKGDRKLEIQWAEI